jgi:hypothetical protein
VLPHQSNEVFTKLETVKKLYWERENRNDQGMCIRIPHTFSTNNTTAPAFILFLVLSRSFPATFSFMVSVRGLTVAGYTVSHEHASSRGSFEDIINAFDFQSRALFVCSGTNCVGHSFPSFPSNPRTRVIRGIGMNG